MFGFGARAATRRAHGAGPASTPAPPPVPSGLPAQSALVARWSADAIPAQPDDSPLAGWTDSVGGIVAAQGTAAAQPRYRTGGAGGKPFVLFAGDQLLDAGPANAVADACRSETSTVLLVCRNVQPTEYGFLFTATPSTGYNLFANGSQAGFFGSGRQRTPYAGAGLTTLVYAGGDPDPTQGRVYINGTCINAHGRVASSAGHSVAIGGSPALGFVGAKAEVYDVVVWNRMLTPPEVMRAEKWVRDRYGAPYPWAGGPFRVFHGDSLTNGEGVTGALLTYPGRVAALNGWPLGTWTNLGHVGITMVQMKAQALATVDPMVALLGSTPLHLAAWEWYNQRGTGDPEGETASYFAARRAAGVARLVLATSTDASDRFETADERAKRVAFNAHFAANWADHADAFVPLHTDPHVGVEGACPSAAPYGPYFDDGIHLTDAGYAAVAAMMAPAMA